MRGLVQAGNKDDYTSKLYVTDPFWVESTGDK